MFLNFSRRSQVDSKNVTRFPSENAVFKFGLQRNVDVDQVAFYLSVNSDELFIGNVWHKATRKWPILFQLILHFCRSQNVPTSVRYTGDSRSARLKNITVE